MSGFTGTGPVPRVRQKHTDAALWYKFDDADPGDSTKVVLNRGTLGSAFDLTFSGSPQYGIAGPIGRSVAADSSTGATSANGVELGNGTAITLWAWVTLLDIGSPCEIFALVRTGDFQRMAGIHFDGGFDVGVTAAGGFASVGWPALPVLTPTLVVLCRNAGSLKMYVDAVRVSTSSPGPSGSISWTGESTSTFVSVNGNDAGPIVIHEAGAYVRTLSASEVGEMWRIGMGYP